MKRSQEIEDMLKQIRARSADHLNPIIMSSREPSILYKFDRHPKVSERDLSHMDKIVDDIIHEVRGETFHEYPEVILKLAQEIKDIISFHVTREWRLSELMTPQPTPSGQPDSEPRT